MRKFYTTKGDDGYTGLLGKERLPKYHPKIEAIGAMDEASAALGLARSQTCSPESAEILLSVQRDLYKVMGEVAASKENSERFHSIDADKVAWLESQIEHIGSVVKMPDTFIVPGNTQAGAAIAMARTIMRRAERLTAVLLHQNEIKNRELYRYLNRASSLCFVLELFEYTVSGMIAPEIAK
jgi:cob(I)alamin adenosyltransferase